MRDSKPTAKPRIAPVLLWPASVVPEVGNRGHVTLGYGRERSTDAEAEHVVVNPALEGMVGIPEAKRWQEAAQELLARATFSALDVIDAFGQLATSVGSTLSPLPGKDVKVSAHTFRFISPTLTDRNQIPNPCTTCHTDKSTAWALEALRHWPEQSPWRLE
jgi:hypothetical protein